jgi:hypothetical protein
MIIVPARNPIGVCSAMTTAASHDSVDPTAGQQIGPPDELEHWLTDLRVNLSEDRPDWLTPQDGTNDPAPGLPTVLPPTEEHTEQDSGTTASSTNSSESRTVDPTGPTGATRPTGATGPTGPTGPTAATGPTGGRHRAAD